MAFPVNQNFKREGLPWFPDPYTSAIEPEINICALDSVLHQRSPSAAARESQSHNRDPGQSKIRK